MREDDNQAIGRKLYAVGDDETRAWFRKQWLVWPERADARLTANISFHYGGVLAFRSETGKDPDMSSDLRSHVDWHDAHQPKDASHDR